MPYGEILGQDNCLAVLKRSLATGRTAHAYLFEGTEGCGKKKAALAFIKIDQVRQLQRELSLRPFEASKKACIIDGADRLNPASGNALLKTLEEPPGNALIILVTANADAVR